VTPLFVSAQGLMIFSRVGGRDFEDVGIRLNLENNC